MEIFTPEQRDLLAAIGDGLSILVLVQGALTDGSAHYAYASIPCANYVAFKQAEAVGHYDLAAFGTILVHGDGKEPPLEVQERMVREYGANHRLESELRALMKDFPSDNA